MALPLVTAAVALFYLGAIPLQIAVCWRTGSGLGVGVAPFENRFALRRAQKHSPQKPMKLPKNIDLSAVLRAGKCLLRHLKLEGVRCTGEFGCDDAAVTALVCGGMNSLGCALRARSKKVLISLRPNFNAAQLQADVFGMISVRVGHIMLAALLGLIEISSGRLSQWKSTLSKAL